MKLETKDVKRLVDTIEQHDLLEIKYYYLPRVLRGLREDKRTSNCPFTCRGSQDGCDLIFGYDYKHRCGCLRIRDGLITKEQAIEALKAVLAEVERRLSR
jgi:hypothetical protein